MSHLLVRRFFCGSGSCGRRTFAEQVAGQATRHGRRTTGLGTMLRPVALALGGRAGSRLTPRLAAGVSRSTLLRLIRASPDPPAGSVLRRVAVAAWRRGHRGGGLCCPRGVWRAARNRSSALASASAGGRRSSGQRVTSAAAQAAQSSTAE